MSGPGRRIRAHGPAVLLLLLGVLGVLTMPTSHGALLGRVTNSTNTAASGIFASCQSGVRDFSAFVAYPFAESAGPTAADATTNGRNGTYSATGVTYAQAGPCPRDAGRSVLLNGTTSVIRGPQASNPQVFSVQVWFRTTTTLGGKLVGFGDSLLLDQQSVLGYDRHVYMTATGQLTFGVQPAAGRRTVTSPAAYNDGAWHQVVGTLGSNGLRLYVDGQLVASDPAVTSAGVYSGAWRFGWDNLTLWPGATLIGNRFAGHLAWGAVFPTALTPTQVEWLYATGR